MSISFTTLVTIINTTALSAVMLCLIVILQTSWKDVKWYLRALTVPLIWALGAAILAPAWGEFTSLTYTLLSVAWATTMVGGCFFFKDVPNPFGDLGRSLFDH